MKGCKTKQPKSQESNDPSVNEIQIEINDSSSTHNNNFAITLKSKNVDVDKLLLLSFYLIGTAIFSLQELFFHQLKL